METVQLVLLGAIAAGVLWFGWSKNFFKWNPNLLWDSQVHFGYLLIAFSLYFGLSFFIAPIYLDFFRKSYPHASTVALASWLNFVNSGSILVALAILWRFLPGLTRRGILHCQSLPLNLSQDLKMGFFAWALSFPLVIFLTTFLEWIVIYLFKATYIPDQMAVLFVRMTFEQPLYFAMTVVTIVILTPLVEETLFRGFLQSFIRRHLGPKQAIFITSLFFAFFHFAPEQGLGNIPIVGTLFALALFLGFLYEKQGSLFASISLHALFNGISILNLYFLGRIPFFF